MTLRDQLKLEIDHLDEQYLDLAYKVIHQFPHNVHKVKKQTQSEYIASLFQKIADTGGSGINDPQKWQREIRKDRPLPFRKL